VRYPLAVRSSSLLEDASYVPFAGIYRTYMISNNAPSLEDRLDDLTKAIKLIYASTFFSEAKSYLDSTPNRLEEEKMAVVIQEVVGRRHGGQLYPDIAGVARSRNFYPIGDLTREEGIVCAVLGLGRPVVEGGRCTRFSPKNPAALFDLLGARDFLMMSQREFWALCAEPKAGGGAPGARSDDLELLELGVAAEHGTLDMVGSTCSHATGAMTDGCLGPGVKLVSFARLLKDPDFRLGEALSFLLEVGKTCFSWPVEIEFAVKLGGGAAPHELGFLQMRPMSVFASREEVRDIPRERTICTSRQSLGPGQIEAVRDIVYVRQDRFDRALTEEIAGEVGDINERIKQEDRRYVLMGPGRWGSTDWRLGVPVTWAQICNASCIVETEMSGLRISPSQGSHFFHNVTSFGVGYLTVSPGDDGGFMDTGWLALQAAHFETEHVRHLRFEAPVRILIDGHTGFGAVLKPDDDSGDPAGGME
jgi:hypothetical protein